MMWGHKCHTLICDFRPNWNPTLKSGKGGGLAIYINKRVCQANDMEIFDPDKKNTEKFDSGEYQFVKIHNCKGFMHTKIISNVYRSPSKRPDSFLRNLDSTMQKLSGRHGKKHVILVGDLNINLINHATDRSSQDLVDSMASSGFLQLIARPTRLTDHSATLIDHIYTNHLENTKNCNVITTFGRFWRLAHIPSLWLQRIKEIRGHNFKRIIMIFSQNTSTKNVDLPRRTDKLLVNLINTCTYWFMFIYLLNYILYFDFIILTPGFPEHRIVRNPTNSNKI